MKNNNILNNIIISSFNITITILFYLDPKRFSCLRAILAMLKRAQDAAANTGKRTIISRTSMKQSYDYIFLKYYNE